MCDKPFVIKPNFIGPVLMNYSVFSFLKGHSVLGKKTKSNRKRPSAQRHAHSFAAVMLLHINWNAAHEIVHPAATPKVFQYGYVIGQFTDGIIVHLNVHHLAVFTTKLLYLFG